MPNQPTSIYQDIRENQLIEFVLPLKLKKRTSELNSVYMQQGRKIHAVIERLGTTTAGAIHRETDISLKRIISHIRWGLVQSPPKIKFTSLKVDFQSTK
jgi:hypothetical protein